MDITIIGDFADPLSFLASQRTEAITSLGLQRVQWLAVEEDRMAPMSGRPLSRDIADALNELGRTGEIIPAAGTRVPNSLAATAAYAESLSDGAADAMRRALFDAVWLGQRRVDDPDVIRSIVFDVLNPTPPGDIEARIRANQPIVPLDDPDPFAVTRRLGFTVSMGRGPLTDAGHQRIKEWSAMWRRHGEPALPLVLTPATDQLAGAAALRWLADQLPTGARPAAAGLISTGQDA